VLVEDDSPTIASQPAKKFSAPKIDTSDVGCAEEGPSFKLPENLTPMARLRNPISYEVFASY
jgi:hypothetical protein